MGNIIIKELIRTAIEAVEDEIRAVTLKPSRELLTATKLPGNKQFEGHVYAYSTSNPSFEHVDELVAVGTQNGIAGKSVMFQDDLFVIRFEKPLPEPVLETEVEWVNDFILRRVHDQLDGLLDKSSKGKIERLEEILNQKDASGHDEIEGILHDGQRNEAQTESIIKSQKNRVTFVWGPPGTGKTSTLGFIIANYLKAGKTVLFASNTNRAVDVGLLSVLNALRYSDAFIAEDEITRFGEPALDSERVRELEFARQTDRLREASAGLNSPDRDQIRRKLILDTIQKLEDSGKAVPSKLTYELELLENNGADDGDKDGDLPELLHYKEIRRKKLVAATLARVCTSELLQSLEFDAVVIDEASMANIPYLLVLASKSKSHIVFAGDPMQLPPISATDKFEYRDFLEKDIYTLVSGAKQMEDLFLWKDENPEITCFFDTQYRLNKDLAGIISDVFYAGRLRTGKVGQTEQDVTDKVSVNLVDTSRYNPSIIVNKNEGGFRPENEVHRDLVLELSKRLILRERYHPGQIGIIVPFRSVVWDYRKTLRSNGFGDIEVGTVHTFQGREKHVIIFDSVMSGQGNGPRKRHFSVRPFDENKNGLAVPRLLNVAFSRARERFVVLADLGHVNQVYGNMFLGNLLRKIGEAG